MQFADWFVMQTFGWQKIVWPHRLLVAGVVAMLWAAAVGSDEPAAPRPAGQVRGFELEDLNGEKVRMSNFDGRALVVVFWASWDSSSRRQLPALVSLQHDWRDKPVRVVGVSLDNFRVTTGVTNEFSMAALRGFAVSNGLNFPVLLANSDVLSEFGGLSYLPTTFVLNTNGVVVATHQGVTEKSVLESSLKRALETQ